MAKSRPGGKCHICGKFCKLSKEHIPPKKAFNNRKIIVVKGYSKMSLGPDNFPKGPQKQGGNWVFSLCEKCNSDTGHLYGHDFVNWCYLGMDIILKSGGNPSLIYLQRLKPLRILKQIVTMFFSINSPEFGDVYPELRKFVLERDKKYLPSHLRFFVYYNISDFYRFIGQSVAMKGRGNYFAISEFNYPPYGYVMTSKSPSPDKRLFEITHFSEFEYDETSEMEIKLSLLEVNTQFPADYRSEVEIQKDVIRNKLKSAGLKPSA